MTPPSVLSLPPRTAHYPVGLGDSRVQVLLVDQGAGPGAEPVVMTTYTLHLFREGPPSLPLFGNHVMCGFIQVCRGWRTGWCMSW